MTLLTALLTHLDADAVDGQVSYLRSLAPDARLVVCHGGTRKAFDGLQTEDALFIEDPSLRGPHFDKSINDTLMALYTSYVRDDPAIELVYVIEYDHLILRGDFEHTLVALANRSPAGLWGKSTSPRNDTNWSHFLKRRLDPQFNGFIAGLSRRDEPSRRFGCLGTGMLFRREALEAFCSMTPAPPYYVELFVPTVLYHLGFEVADIDAISGLYSAVRWRPEYSASQAIEQKRAGATFIHPFKRPDRLGAIAEAAQPPQPAL